MNFRFLLALFNAVKDVPKSKTLIFGYLLAIVGVFVTYFDDLRAFIPDQYEGLVYSAIGFVVVVLRYLTDRPIKEKRDE